MLNVQDPHVAESRLGVRRRRLKFGEHYSNEETLRLLAERILMFERAARLIRFQLPQLRTLSLRDADITWLPGNGPYVDAVIEIEVPQGPLEVARLKDCLWEIPFANPVISVQVKGDFFKFYFRLHLAELDQVGAWLTGLGWCA